MEKLRHKNQLMSGLSYDFSQLEKMSDFQSFDDAVTAPLNGFGTAENYWRQCSAVKVLDDIRCPALAVSAANDPFLAGECYPTEIAKNHPHFHLEVPVQGGHVGFMQSLDLKNYWINQRIMEFFAQEQ